MISLPPGYGGGGGQTVAAAGCRRSGRLLRDRSARARRCRQIAQAQRASAYPDYIRGALAAARPPGPVLAAAEIDRRLVRQERLALALVLLALAPGAIWLRRGKAAGLVIFHRQPSGVVPARELHQCVDPGIDRRMRGKEVGEAFARIVDAHFHDGGIGGLQLAAPLDLAQR